MIKLVALLSVFAVACTNTEPGAPGEACNFDAPNSDGCDAVSVCLSGVCHLLCGSPSQSSPQCGGGSCQTYQTFGGWEGNACSNPDGGGGDGGGDGGGGGGGGSCDTSACNAYINQCANNPNSQAPCYCAAACSCHYCGDPSCEQQNRGYAQQLGTTCSY